MILDLPGVKLQLLPERAALDPLTRTLFVADLHLGKAAVFRDAGLPLPEGPDAETLEALSTLIRRVQASRIVILGDVFHDHMKRRDHLLGQLHAWSAAHAGLALTIVPGNHDRRICWEEWLPAAEILTAGMDHGRRCDRRSRCSPTRVSGRGDDVAELAGERPRT